MKKLTLSERASANTAIEIVMRQVEGCETGKDAQELAINILHGAAAALVGVSGYDFTVKYLKVLTGVIESEAAEEKLVEGH